MSNPAVEKSQITPEIKGYAGVQLKHGYTWARFS